MKTKLTAMLLAAALALTLAACGEKDIADTPLPDEPPEPVAEQPAADDEWTVLHADDVLLRADIEASDAVFRGGGRLGAAQDRAHTRQKLHHAEGLGYKVVCAAVETDDAVILRVLCG